MLDRYGFLQRDSVCDPLKTLLATLSFEGRPTCDRLPYIRSCYRFIKQ